MSVNRNFGRTLSGATDISVDNLNIGNNINAIRINGNSGLPNQVIAKNGTTGKLEWDFVETTSIPDNSIENVKLKDKTIENNKIKDGTIIGSLMASDIGFSTTGNISAETLRANTFIAPKTGTTLIELDGSDGSISGNTLLLNGKDGTTTAVITGNVDINVSPYQDGDLSVAGDYSSLNGNITLTNGNLSVVGGNTTLYNLTNNNSIIANGNGIYTTDIRGSSNANSPYNYSIIGSNGNITTNGNITINTGSDLLINSGGKIDLFTDNGTTRTFDIDGSTGDLKIYNPTNGNERIELDGTTGNIIISSGGRIDMFNGNNLNIELNGANGIIDCNDINVLNHTGTIAFNQIRTNKLSLPENGTATCEIFDTGNIVSNGSITAGSIAGTSLSSSTNITATGSITGNSLVSNSTITATGKISGSSASFPSGDVIANEFLVKTGATTNCILNSNGLEISGANKDIEANGCLLQVSDIYVNGNHGTTSAVISGNVIITSSTGDTPQDGNLSIAGDITSTDGNITLTNGDITLTNGTLRGNVDGTITEEHIDGESLRLRTNPNGAGTPQGLIIEDGFQILGYTTSAVNSIDIDCSTGIIRHAGIQQTLGTSANSFSSQTTFNATCIHRGNTLTYNDFSTSWYDNNTSSNVNGVRSVVIDGLGVKLYPANNGVERLRIDRDGSIDFKSTIGSINGFSSSTPNSITNFNFMDNSNYQPHPRFVQICDPSVASIYTMTAGAWRNLAGYVDNNVLKPRYTNADCSFTALGTTARMNVIFSASVNNNCGIRFRIVEINGSSANTIITGTQRLFIGSSAHRGQHEYTCYYNGFTTGYDYVITPEVYVGGSSTITMYVGSNSGSATIQNADSPIIVEVAFMNRANINTGNIYQPPSGGK